ncbi:MAG: hypothetical protein LLF83_00375 [Methanobacterium sp.]|nr:hypothetical protein [Methanobacterium sp.]
MRRDLLYSGVVAYILALIFIFIIPYAILEYILVVIGSILVILGLILT